MAEGDGKQGEETREQPVEIMERVIKLHQEGNVEQSIARDVGNSLLASFYNWSKTS